MRTPKTNKIGKLLAVTGACLLTYTAWSQKDNIHSLIQSYFAPDLKLTEKEIKKIINEIAIAQYESLYEVSQTAQRVLLNLEERNMKDMLSEEDLQNLLVSPEMKNVLEAQQNEVLKKYDPSLTIEILLNRMEELNSEDLNCVLEQFNKIIKDCIRGEIPVIPNLYSFANPDDITDRLLLDVIEDCLRAKRIALTKIFADPSLMKECSNDPVAGFIPSLEIGELIKSVCAKADMDVISDCKFYSDLEEGLKLTIHKCIIGVKCRRSADFKNARLEVIERHTQQITQLINQSSADNSPVSGNSPTATGDVSNTVDENNVDECSSPQSINENSPSVHETKNVDNKNEDVDQSDSDINTISPSMSNSLEEYSSTAVVI